MKTKNKVIATVFGVLASSLFFIVAPTPAIAGECSAADPCLTYAVLDSSGVVTNVIVCQPSFCGSGRLSDGTTVVPQVAATPTGQNQGGFYNHAKTPGIDVVHSNGTFTINNEIVVNKVDVVTNTTNTETSTISASISEGNQTAFSYEDTVGKTIGEIEFTTLPLKDNVSATVSATEVTTTFTKTETTTFEGRKTAEEVSSVLTQRNLTLLQSRITILLMLLDGWIK
jgi:hypothetical protein